MVKTKKKFKRKKLPTCYFCQEAKEPDYKKIEDLEKFTTDRGRILGRLKTGLCQKHQRRLTKEIKRARFLALLPFVSQI